MVSIESHIFFSVNSVESRGIQFEYISSSLKRTSSRLKQKQCSQLDTPLMEIIIVSEEVLELSFFKARGGGVLDKSLGGEERRGPSYPDPV